ncbi:MAG: hypothetical protein MJ072_00880, partial [Clostridia bacterium]|nr:hypothetical protein [Clostridia bacterium]
KNGSFKCENCADGGTIEMTEQSYIAVKTANEGNEPDLTDDALRRALKFFDFYVTDKTGEEIKSLKEFIAL